MRRHGAKPFAFIQRARPVVALDDIQPHFCIPAPLRLGRHGVQQAFSHALSAGLGCHKDSVHQEPGVFGIPLQRRQQRHPPDRPGPAIDLRHVAKRAADQRAVHRLEPRHTQEPPVGPARTDRVAGVQRRLKERQSLVPRPHGAAQFGAKGLPVQRGDQRPVGVGKAMVDLDHGSATSLAVVWLARSASSLSRSTPKIHPSGVAVTSRKLSSCPGDMAATVRAISRTCTASRMSPGPVAARTARRSATARFRPASPRQAPGPRARPPRRTCVATARAPASPGSSATPPTPPPTIASIRTCPWPASRRAFRGLHQKSRALPLRGKSGMSRLSPLPQKGPVPVETTGSVAPPHRTDCWPQARPPRPFKPVPKRKRILCSRHCTRKSRWRRKGKVEPGEHPPPAPYLVRDRLTDPCLGHLTVAQIDRLLPPVRHQTGPDRVLLGPWPRSAPPDQSTIRTLVTPAAPRPAG